jgi:uncharacterized membrane protein YhaH (DUF805 family)
MKKLFSYKGRANRANYLVIYFSIIILWWLYNNIDFLSPFHLHDLSLIPGMILLLLVGVLPWMLVIILMIFLTIRRFHDLNESGWSIFLYLVPFYNIYLQFKLFLVKGTSGPNKFGNDQLQNPGFLNQF